MKNMLRILSVMLCMLMLCTQAMALELPQVNQNQIMESIRNFVPGGNVTEEYDSRNFAASASDNYLDRLEKLIHFGYITAGETTITDWCVPFAGGDGSYLYLMAADYIVITAKNYDSNPENWGWFVGEWASDGDYAAASLNRFSTSPAVMILETTFKPVTEYAGVAPLTSTVSAYGLCRNDDGLYWGEFDLKLSSDSTHYTVTGGDAPTQGSPVFNNAAQLVGFVGIDETSIYSTSYYLEQETGKKLGSEGIAASSVDGGSSASSEPAPEPVVTQPPAPVATEQPAPVATEQPAADPAATEPESEPEKKSNTKYYIIGAAAIAIVAFLVFNSKKKAAEKIDPAPARTNGPFVKAYDDMQNKDKTANVASSGNGSNNLETLRINSDSTGIKCTAGRHLGAAYPIKSTVGIGIDPKRCGIVYVKEPGISRLHCTVAPAGDGKIILTDEGSSYGTFVNGEKLTPHIPRVLNAGESFTLADGRNAFVVFTEKK